MSLKCFKYDKAEQQAKCSLKKMDGHCFNCVFYQDDDKFEPASEETKRNVFEKFIEISSKITRRI